MCALGTVIALLLDKKRKNEQGQVEAVDVEMAQKPILGESSISEDPLARALAREIAHDLNSPLAALNIALNDLDKLPDCSRDIVKQAIERIHDISQQLQSRGRENQSHLVQTPIATSLMVLPLIQSFLSSKKLEFHSDPSRHMDFEFDEGIYGYFTDIDPIRVRRVFNYFIDRAFQLGQKSGRLSIRLEPGEGFSSISIIDPSVSIPNRDHYLDSAKSLIETWGGTLNIDVSSTHGTVIKFSIPKVDPPSWFVRVLKIQPGSRIVTIDDDGFIHSTWEKRLYTYQPELLHFGRPEELLDWAQKQTPEQLKNTLYLVDYEYVGQSMNGLDLIETLGIEENSILVSGRADELQLIEKARIDRLKLKMIPKTISSLVPLQATEDFLD